MHEYIEKVKMNYTYYQGADLYSDGDIEDELLEIVQNHSTNEFERIIKERLQWPILYHLSPIRGNIINWYNFKKEANLLEIGAGCGAITQSLVDCVSSVTAVDLSKRRSLINAYRNKDKDNLEIIVGNFNDVAKNLKTKFDYITLIGVFEYAEVYIREDNAPDLFLQKVKSLLKEDGKLIIAIENQLGLKYFAGCKEDHVGICFEGIEGYTNTSGVRTYSKKALTEILKRNGLGNARFYYPYPDYKLPNKIFSDEYLPQKGELCQNMRNFDADRMLLFDEAKVYDTLLEAGLFQEFSNSFLVIVEKE